MLKVFVALIAALSVFCPALTAEDVRVMPLDMHLIIDDSAAFAGAKINSIAWINGHVVDRILMEGDRVTVWAAGDKAEIIFSGTVSPAGGDSGKKDIKDKLQALHMEGERADFSGALAASVSRRPQTPATHIPYTMLIAASAAGLEPVISGSSNLLRWSRSERYQGWQVFIVAPDISRTVRDAAEAFMGSR